MRSQGPVMAREITTEDEGDGGGCDVSCRTMAVDSSVFTRQGNTEEQAVEKQTQTARQARHSGASGISHTS